MNMNIELKFDREYCKKIKIGNVDFITVWVDSPDIFRRKTFEKQIFKFITDNFFFTYSELEILLSEGKDITIGAICDYIVNMTSMHDIKTRNFNTYEVMVWLAWGFKELRDKIIIR